MAVALLYYFFNRNHSFSSRLLTSVIFFMNYAGIHTALFSTNFFIQFPFLWRITLFPQMLMPPAAFIYVRAVLNQELRFKKTDILILLPILFYAVNFYPVYSMPLAEKRELIDTK